MGTSTPFGGPGNKSPLIPSWLEGDDSIAPADKPPIPAAGEDRRLSVARGNMTRFAGSGGSDRASLGRALSDYVRKSGSARQAAQRMGASRTTGVNLIGFLNSLGAQGLDATLQEFNLSAMAGAPAVNVFLALTEHICPNSGSVDDGIAREAYLETIAELASEGLTDLSSFNADQLDVVFELFATHAIEARICNDIGTKLITKALSANNALDVEKQLRDFIRGAVADALTRARAYSPVVTQGQVQAFVDEVYESAFSILQALGDVEASQ